MTRAHVSCETNKPPVDSHFRDTTKMGTAGVAARAVKDYKLTRYACYLIAQNGDSNKPEIALAQAYFAVQTRRFYRSPGQARLVKRLCPFGFGPKRGQQKSDQPKPVALTCFGGPSGGQPAAQAAAAALRALRAALANAYAFPQLRAPTGSTPCEVNKKATSQGQSL